MEPMRHAWLAPPLIVVAVVAGAIGITATPTGATLPAWDPPACAAGGAGSGPQRAAWFRRDELLDPRGSLAGYRVTLGLVGDGTARQLDLPPEAFVTGPSGATVLVGADDGRRSRLRLIDVDAGCARELDRTRDVIRSALLEPAGDAVVEHRLDRRTRADLGIWRRPLDGSEPIRLLEGIPPDPAYGPTFGTELALGDDGTVVASACGAWRCRARVLGDGVVSVIDDLGPLAGLAHGTLIAHRPCAGLPCALEAITLRGDARRILAHQAGPAVVAGEVVLIERGSRAPADLVAIDLADGDMHVVALPHGLRLLATGARATSAVAHRDDTAVIVQSDAATLATDARLLDPQTGVLAPVPEVLP